MKTDEQRAKVRDEYEIQRKVNRLDESGKHTAKALALDLYDTAILIEAEYGGKAIKKEDGKFNAELDLSPTDSSTVCQFILQIGSLLQAINERGNILIQDVKLENILYDGSNFRLIDFGEAIDFNEPPESVHFAVTPLITTSLQVWMLKTFGEESHSHSYEQVKDHPLLVLLRQNPSLVDMQALVINNYLGAESDMESMYRIPQLPESNDSMFRIHEFYDLALVSDQYVLVTCT